MSGTSGTDPGVGGVVGGPTAAASPPTAADGSRRTVGRRKATGERHRAPTAPAESGGPVGGDRDRVWVSAAGCSGGA